MTECFEDMLRRSIPLYEVMRAAVAELALWHAQDRTVVVDLGTSRGEALASVRDRIQTARPGSRISYLGAEVSGPMLTSARERFAGAADVEIAEVDLRGTFPALGYRRPSVVLCVLTLQFVPVNYRQRVISQVRDQLTHGGALILVEKVLGGAAGLDELFVELYHRMKREHGYSAEEVATKAAALEGALVPLTARWNEDLLRGVGFSEVDCFWRWMNFAAWVAVK